MPDLEGKSQDELESYLEAAGFKLGTVTTEASEKEAGTVLRQDPKAGSKAEKGSTINVVVSDGSKAKAVVPYLVGKSLEDAQAALLNAGLTIGSISYDYSSTYAEGEVMWQQYDANAQLDKGTAVKIRVSKGNKPADQPTTRTRQMKMMIINEATCAGHLNGTIVKGIAGFYYVKSGVAVYRCKARGIFKQRDIKPAVGDEVTIEVIPDNDDSVITDIKERKNSFIRPFVANVDCFAVVTAALKPAPVLPVIDRFLVMAEKAETDIVICINKCDLAENADDRKNKSGRKAAENIEILKEIYGPLYPVVCIDSVNETGFDELRRVIKGKKTALAGPSGVGKSTILNRLIPHAEAETGKISEKSQRGKHTTRHSELFHDR